MDMPDPESLAATIGYINEQRLTQLHELHRRLDALEGHMATTDAQIAAINANLESIRADVQRLSEAAKLQPLVGLSKQIAGTTPEPITS